MTQINITPEQATKLLDDLRAKADHVAESVSKVQSTATDKRFIPSHEKRVKEAVGLAEKVAAKTEPAKSFVSGSVDLSDTTATTISSASSSPTHTAATGSSSSTSPSSSSETTAAKATYTDSASTSTTTDKKTVNKDSSSTSRSSDRSTSATPNQVASTKSDPSTASPTSTKSTSSPSTNSVPQSATGATGTTQAPAAQATTPAPQASATASPATTTSTPQASATAAPVSAASTTGMTGPQVIDTFANTMKQMYPVIPDTSINSKLHSDLASGTGGKQPADTVYLTDNQTRILAEAIAHNINTRRQAQADAAAIPIGGGGVDGMGSFGGSVDMSGISLAASNGYHESVLMLCEQIVNMQPPIPYAWGGGSLEGPSQGISDGGGYADACGDYNKIGFDCSGLSRYVTYQTLGEEIPRTSQPQFSYCTPVSQPMIGDLGFPPGGSPGHVVVYVGNGMICEAQQSGTYIMYSNASPSYLWGRPQTSPNWQLEQEGAGGY